MVTPEYLIKFAESRLLECSCCSMKQGIGAGWLAYSSRGCHRFPEIQVTKSRKGIVSGYRTERECFGSVDELV